MQVNTVWAAHEMHHQNGRIMQMLFATLQSLCFLSSTGVWREYKLTTDSELHDGAQSFTINFSSLKEVRLQEEYRLLFLYKSFCSSLKTLPPPSLLYCEKRDDPSQLTCLYFLFISLSPCSLTVCRLHSSTWIKSNNCRGNTKLIHKPIQEWKTWTMILNLSETQMIFICHLQLQTRDSETKGN